MTMIENLSTLTTIPKKHLERLLNKVFLCIGDAVEETVLKNEKLTKIDIGIGTLVISIYDDVLKYMQTIFKAFYDSWYHPARCESPAYWWNRGMQVFAKKFIPEDLDLNNLPTIQNGITIIQKRMHSVEIADAAKAKANQYASDGGGQALYEKSLKILGID